METEEELSILKYDAVAAVNSREALDTIMKLFAYEDFVVMERKDVSSINENGGWVVYLKKEKRTI